MEQHLVVMFLSVYVRKLGCCFCKPKQPTYVALRILLSAWSRERMSDWRYLYDIEDLLHYIILCCSFLASKSDLPIPFSDLCEHDNVVQSPALFWSCNFLNAKYSVRSVRKRHLDTCLKHYYKKVDLGAMGASSRHLSSSEPWIWLAFRLSTCFMAVKKPCPLLKPGNQYDFGRPWYRNVHLFFRTRE